MKFALVMLCSGIINGIWTWYIKYVNAGNAWMAASTGELIFLMQAFNTLSYVHNPRFIIAVVIGGFVGTYLTVKYSRKL